MGRIRYAALGAYVALYLSWQALRWIPLSQPLVEGLLIVPLALAAVVAAWRASRRAAGAPRLRSAWRWIAVGLAGQAAGGSAQLVYEQVLHMQAYPTLADLLYLSFYPLVLVGILRFPAVRRGGRAALELALDCAVVALGGSAVFVFFILGPDAVAGGPPLETATTIAYPIGDMVLLVGLGTALLRSPLPSTRASLRLMTLAIGLFVVADLIYGYIVLHGSYQGGDPNDTLYVLAFACFVMAAWRQPAVAPAAGQAPERSAAADAPLSWLPYAAIAISVAVLVRTDVGEPFFPHVAIALIVTLVIGLVVVRQVLSLRSVHHARARLDEAQRLARLGSWSWDAERDRFALSAEELRLLGCSQPATGATHRDALRAIHPDDRERVRQIVREALEGQRPFACEMRIVRPGGEVRTLLARGDVTVHGGTVIGMHGTHQDISDRKRMESQLAYQASHDPLTGLPNRGRFAEEIERILRYAARHGRPGAVLMLDVDNFKLVNDAHGNAVGDAALKALAETVAQHTHGTDVVARLGGDEFALALPEADEARARATAEAIRRGLADEPTPPITVSVGIALFDGTRELIADEAMAAADVALYEAKEGGRDQVRVYRGEASGALTWVERIRRALDEGRLVLYAQPILDFKRHQVSRHELLVRMLSDDGDAIPPGAFLPTAERFGLIGELDRWVVGEGLALAREGERVSINLSAASIGDERVLAAVRAALDDGVPPDYVMLEITETAAMANMDAAREFAQALSDLGCGVALDDFGTGFGSFSYLKHLPTCCLKIDTEFVRELVWNTTDQQVVKSINAVAHSLGKRTIAEGVEDEATLEALRALGIDCAQGHFIGRPRRISHPTRFEHGLRRGRAERARP